MNFCPRCSSELEYQGKEVVENIAKKGFYLGKKERTKYAEAVSILKPCSMTLNPRIGGGRFES